MLIELKGINKTYDNGQPLHVLKGIDLAIDRGEFLRGGASRSVGARQDRGEGSRTEEETADAVRFRVSASYGKERGV